MIKGHGNILLFLMQKSISEQKMKIQMLILKHSTEIQCDSVNAESYINIPQVEEKYLFQNQFHKSAFELNPPLRNSAKMKNQLRNIG